MSAIRTGTLKMTLRSFVTLMLVCLCLPAVAATTTYDIEFVVTSGSPAPVSGSFAYDQDSRTFSNFVVIWDGLTFDLTAPANADPYWWDPLFAEECGLSGAALNFALMSHDTCFASRVNDFWHGSSTATPSFSFSSCSSDSCRHTVYGAVHRGTLGPTANGTWTIKQRHAQSCLDTVVYFGNGVNTTELDAQRAARMMGGMLAMDLPTSEVCRYRFKVAYNQSENLLLDMLQAARETLGNEYPTLLMAFILEKAGLPSSVFASLLPAGALQEFNERFRSATVQHMIAGSASAATVNSHVSLYQNDLIGKRVILVAHSQGNIYSNLASARLQSENPERYTRFAIIPVASPEYYTEKSLVGHVRFADDLVIAAVQVARGLLGLPPPLRSNDQDNADVDFWSHFFLEAYLADASSRRFILDGIVSTSAQLPPSPSSTATYRLTASGVVRSRQAIPGLPIPIDAGVGERISVYWDIDGSVAPVTSPGAYVYWRGAIRGFGFFAPRSSAAYLDNAGLNNYVYIATEATRSYYNLQGMAFRITPSYSIGPYMLLCGPAGVSLQQVGQLDPRPLSQWSGCSDPPYNYVAFITCPVAGGGCAAISFIPDSLSYELRR